MGLRFGSVLLAALIFVSLGALTSMIAPVRLTGGVEVPRTVHMAPPYTLGYAGLGPTTISLSWTESSDASFFEYVLRKYSVFLNEWETIHTELIRTNTSYFYSPLNAGASESWQVTYQDTLGFSYSNILDVTQPPLASLSSSQLTSTSAQLQWDNNAKYGGRLYFSSYQLMESINGGTNFPRVSYTDVNSLSYLLSGLSPSTNYAFYLNTTEQCIGNGCPITPFSSSFSNRVTINTPGPLVASVHASPATVDVGQITDFVCTGAGGASPYTYSWAFGDGSLSTGATTSHTYDASGIMKVVCTVTDILGTTFDTEPITLRVYIDPSITSFTLTPSNLNLGQRITFFVSTSGGNGSLTFSYADLPAGCSSVNSSSFSCTPTSSGTYDVTVTVTDQGQETANSTLRLSISPPGVLGLPQAVGLAVIFGSLLGICALVILSVVLVLRSKKGSQINPQDTESNQGNLSSDQAAGVSELKGSNQGASCKRV